MFLIGVQILKMSNQTSTLFLQSEQTSRAEATHYCDQVICADYKQEKMYWSSTHGEAMLPNILELPENSNAICYWSDAPIITKLLYPFRWISNRYRNIEGPVSLPRPWKASRGGFVDRKRFRYLLSLVDQKPLIIFAQSDSANSVFTELCIMEPDELDQIALVILESPYLSYSMLVRSKILPKRILHWCYSHFGRAERFSVSPVSVAKNWPTRIPLAIVTSKKDTRIPCSLTHSLIELLPEETQLRVLELNSSKNQRFMEDNYFDVESYKTFIQSLMFEFSL